MQTIVTLKSGLSVTHEHVGQVQGMANSPFLLLLNEEAAIMALYNIDEVQSVNTPELDKPKSLIAEAKPNIRLV